MISYHVQNASTNFTKNIAWRTGCTNHLFAPFAVRCFPSVDINRGFTRAKPERLTRQQDHLRHFEAMLGYHQDWLLGFKQLDRRPEDRVNLSPMNGSFEQRLTRSEQVAKNHEVALRKLGTVPIDSEHPGDAPRNRGARLEHLEQLIKSNQAWLRASIKYGFRQEGFGH
jgi:hypothetical protein